ncbi:hypothetical protein CO046_04445 [Candidatus Peregrinibacteria bacterium CG_4_9_14_0_2_um_filter_53_11]|nr:MAG: hypothetical protein CO046_04445 [Candidatus Peregrinibacteria bacterium CG_4_9_14_0_2_um_filter_53_11]
MSIPQKHLDELQKLLGKVQEAAVDEVFIYGVTSRTGRTLRQRIDDFLIDRSSVPIAEKAYFFQLLATMIHAGIPLLRSLKILLVKTENRRLKRIIATLGHDIEHGASFSDALNRFPEIFSDSQRGVLRSAEATGSLEQTLYKIADNLERQQGLQSKLTAALLYPVTVFIALIVSVGIILTFVVPRMQELFNENTIEMPPITRFFLTISLWLTTNWWLFLILTIFAVIGFHFYVSSPEGRFSWDFHKLRIPFVGKLLRTIYVLRFVESLGLLIESGLPINRALEYVSQSIGNEVYKVKTYEALANVQTGSPLSATLATAPFLFPETVTNMLAVAEQSASLGDISIKVGRHYQHEVDDTLKRMTTLLGPILILVIGSAVAFFAIAILSPIFSLTTSIT